MEKPVSSYEANDAQDLLRGEG